MVEIFALNSEKKKNKSILHIDGDAFFVSVEIAKNPKLKGLPVVTGEEKGIVSALSYEAKALGVVRGMPIFKLKKQFPKVIILPGDYKSYVEYSRKMFEIVGRYADEVEEYSIDECFADLTGLDRTLKMSYIDIARKIKEDVTRELGLSVSVGVAPTKVLAKVASKWIKPNGLTLIKKENIKQFLEKVPIGKIWGIGPRTAVLLEKSQIKTAYDFISKDFSWAEENLAKPYVVIREELLGNSILNVDPSPKTLYSSIRKTRTFHPSTADHDFILSQLSKHTEDACAKARHFRLVPRRLSFFLKTKEFSYHTFSLDITPHTNSPEYLISLIKENFSKVFNKKVLYRTSGVILYDLIKTETNTASLFSDSIKLNKFEDIHYEIDRLEEKYNKRLFHLGTTDKALKHKKLGTDSEDNDHHLLFI